MYIRDLSEPRPTPLENGKPIFGTWARAFDDVNLLDISKPFALPLPKWLKNFRIKEWQAFQIQDERHYLMAALINAKYYRFAFLTLWDKELKEKLIFNKVLPFGSWDFPRSLHNSSITSRSYGFYFRIHDWLDADLVEFDIDIQATRRRPSFTAHIELDFQKAESTPLVVCLPFSEQRCLFSHKALGPARGDLVFGGRHINLKHENTVGTLFDYRGLYPYRMANTWATAFGFSSDGRRFGFSIAENQAKESFKYNENVLWIGNKAHLLPPVRITQPSGLDQDWVIQDLEGMVDLNFTPREMNVSAFNLLLTRLDYHAPFGVFNGMMQSTDGENVPIRNLWGLGEVLHMRV